MCLTGLDYFSTIGFQPGIAFLAAGYLSPLATLVLVLVTLLGAYPIYARVAKESPEGQGSFVMLERLLSGWHGKAIILILLGFASTDFIITMTLCAADAATHFIQNPFCPVWAHHQLMITIIFLIVLGAVFLAGFKEAISTAVVLVTSYLFLNVILVARCIIELIQQPQYLLDMWNHLRSAYPSIWMIIGASLLVFPRLALGLSGFETGVSVMPHVRGLPGEEADSLGGRIKNTRKLLFTAALIMCFLLVGSSVASTSLIPAPLFAEGHSANGRAMAYLAHKLLGPTFGSAYDLSTILILWFAGASTMAAILNLIPRYLPRYGMAPVWAKATRPLVLVVTFINILVTLFFRASVDGQAGAYATGLLVLFTSASLACVLSSWNEHRANRFFYILILFVFAYTTIVNIYDRPEGFFISLIFVALILSISLLSRATRSTELRISQVIFDEKATRFIQEALASGPGQIRLLAHRPGEGNYVASEREARWRHSIMPEEGNFIFVEVIIQDASDFTEVVLEVSGHEESGVRVLRCYGLAVPNALAAILLHIRDTTGTLPHAYFGWTEGHPLSYVIKYIFLGEGETAPLTREVLRSIEPDDKKRPLVHVG